MWSYRCNYGKPFPVAVVYIFNPDTLTISFFAIAKTQRLRMLKELALLVTVLTLLADARPLTNKVSEPSMMMS